MLTKFLRSLIAGRPAPGPDELYRQALECVQQGDLRRAAELCRLATADADFLQAHQLLAAIELPGENYVAVIDRLHAHLRPATYVEIGVASGATFRRVRPETIALGIDPHPKLEGTLPSNHRVFAETSDAFFAGHDVIAELGGRRIELAFIDGMHVLEYALRDFANIERLCAPGAVVLLHDCYPLDRRTASRERATLFSSGDVWRLVLLLRKHRPDLCVRTIGTPPTGLGMILNLDPSSRLLSERHDSLVAEFLALDYRVLDERKGEQLALFPNHWPAIAALIDGRMR